MGDVDEEALQRHRDRLRELCTSGGPLDARGAHATISNPAWYDSEAGAWALERTVLHDRLIEEQRVGAVGVVQDRRAIVLAGPPGAGKSTLLKADLGADLERFLWVDPDHFKERLLEQAVADGSFESFLKPPQVRAFEAVGDRFFPMELASLVHEESSRIAATARAEAILRGDNLVIDTVLSNPDAAERLGAQLSRAGYRVRVVDVETSFDVSAARIAQRWRDLYTAALRGDEGAELGGRWVPSEYPRSLFTADGSTSRSEEAARRLAETCPVVERYEVYRVSAQDPVPRLERAVGRPRVGGPLVDGRAADAVRRAEAARAPYRGAGARPSTDRGLGR